jgi:hypothetical protein
MHEYEPDTTSILKEKKGRVRKKRREDEVTGDWRKLHNEQFHNLYSSSNIIRMIFT